jgi:glycosyltransferase involved in cell wall biosynthesis
MDRLIAVIIPAYNEEQTIAEVIRGVRLLGDRYRVVVVNDCSGDGTTRNAEREGPTVIELPVNLGIGGAVQTGLKYAAAAGFEACVQVDGDGQHPPQEIPKLIGPLFEHNLDMVVGSRFMGGTYKVPFMRALGIRTIALFLRASTGVGVRDTTSGFRAIARPAMEFFATCYPQDYPEPESLVLAHMKKFKVAEVAVDMNYREFGVSSITPLPRGLLHGQGAPRHADRPLQGGIGGNGPMLHIRLFVGIISIILFVVTFELIRKGHLREEYAILWLSTSSTVAILSLWPGLVAVLSRVTGLYYITAVLAIVFTSSLPFSCTIPSRYRR